MILMTTAALKAITQNQFQKCFEGVTRLWDWCIASQGEYFEGDEGGFNPTKPKIKKIPLT
jgi:hypothetical protein